MAGYARSALDIIYTDITYTSIAFKPPTRVATAVTKGMAMATMVVAMAMAVAMVMATVTIMKFWCFVCVSE